MARRDHIVVALCPLFGRSHIFNVARTSASMLSSTSAMGTPHPHSGQSACAQSVCPKTLACKCLQPGRGTFCGGVGSLVLKGTSVHDEIVPGVLVALVVVLHLRVHLIPGAVPDFVDARGEAR